MKPKNLRELKPEFLRLYIEEKKSIREIAKIYNVDKSSVSRYIHEDVKPRLRGLNDAQKETAKTLYESGYTIREIAHEIEGSYNTIKTFLIKEYGEITTSRKKKYNHLIDLFVNDYNSGLSSLEIAEKYNVSPSTVLNYIGEKNVKARDYSESSNRYDINEDYFNLLNKNNSYILGLILGCSSENKKSSMDFIDLRFTKKQNSIMNTILKEIYTKDTPSKHNTNSTTVIRVYSKKLVKRILEIKNELISGCIPNELSEYKENFLKGFLESSKIDIKNGICIKAYENQTNFIINLISDYYELIKSNENLSDIFSPSENRKTLGLTFYKDYNIYKINNILGLTNNELNKTLNFTEGSYIIFFHKDNEYNTIKK